MSTLTRLLLALLLLPQGASADDALWRLVEGGGQVLFIRHATTTPGAGDPEGFQLDDCKTQRNLSEAGRAEAKRLGEALRSRKVPLGEVLSSQFCRCHDTAQLAFGTPGTPWTPLSHTIGRTRAEDAQVREIRSRVGGYKGKANLVMMSHGTVALPLTGVAPVPAEIIVLTPLGGDNFRVAGRLPPP